MKNKLDLKILVVKTLVLKYSYHNSSFACAFMSTQELSLEQIAKELTAVRAEGEHERPMDPFLKEANKRRVNVANRFGEVVEAFMRTGTIKGVCRETGISHYSLNKYFFSNPEFCKLLRGASEAIFVEATTTIRDEQASLLSKSQRLAEEALDVMATLLHESESEHIQFRVAQDLLDRDPRISRTKKIESRGFNVTFEAKALNIAMQAAQEIDAKEVKE